jgi:FMN-binding domain
LVVSPDGPILEAMTTSAAWMPRFLDGPGWSRSHPYSLSATRAYRPGEATRVPVGPVPDSVSGATVTSDGYKESLQAALNAAHLQ